MARPKGPPKSSGGPSIGLIFLLALVLAAAFAWWQSGMVPFWDSFTGSDQGSRIERPPVAEAPPVVEQPLPEYPMPELPEKEKAKPLPPVEKSDWAVTGPAQKSATTVAATAVASRRWRNASFMAGSG